MPIYEYKGYTATGEACSGSIDASSEKHALRLLMEKGIVAEQVRTAKLTGQLSPAARAAIYRELSALLSAGIQLDAALELLIKSEGASAAKLLTGVLQRVREGVDLSAAIGEYCGSVSSFELAALSAAEKAGKLPELCSKAAEFIEAMEAVRDKLRSALIYPSFVLALGFIIGVVMLGFVVPHTLNMLSNSGAELPMLSKVVIVLAKVLVIGSASLFVGALVAWFSAKAYAKNNLEFAEQFDRFVLLHLGGAAMAGLVSMRFASILSVLSEAGMPIVNALPIAGEGTGNRWLKKLVLEQTERVRNGVAVSDAIDAVPVLRTELTGWARVGETGGCLPQMLEVAASKARRMWEKYMSVRLALLEPIMLVAIGGFVFLIAIAVLLPLLQMTKGFGF
ncbi:MAG: type II secretion system F family protein [Kiritimatiellae bacterium]|nr:type II secretion system F family protein [Kiritimatiellia bacterium]